MAKVLLSRWSSSHATNKSEASFLVAYKVQKLWDSAWIVCQRSISHYPTPSVGASRYRSERRIWPPCATQWRIKKPKMKNSITLKRQIKVITMSLCNKIFLPSRETSKKRRLSLNGAMHTFQAVSSSTHQSVESDHRSFYHVRVLPNDSKSALHCLTHLQ